MKIISAFLLLSFLSSAQAALVHKDDTNAILTIKVHMVYSGLISDRSYADESTREIIEMWTETPTDIKLSGKEYRVVFDITHSLIGEQKIMKPTSCGFNYIAIRENKYDWERSHYNFVGAQRGAFYIGDNLGSSTTAAHEFGHGLMLSHNHGDQSHAEIPGIMFARGTLVKNQFQYDPKATAGQKGSTLNPIHRKVRAEDIKAIPFQDLQFNQHGYACLGQGALILPR